MSRGIGNAVASKVGKGVGLEGAGAGHGSGVGAVMVGKGVGVGEAIVGKSVGGRRSKYNGLYSLQPKSRSRSWGFQRRYKDKMLIGSKPMLDVFDDSNQVKQCSLTKMTTTNDSTKEIRSTKSNNKEDNC